MGFPREELVMVNQREIKKALDFSLNLSEKAGAILLKYQKRIDRLKISQKDIQGVVSTADLASEKCIINAIKKTYPGHFVLAEELAYSEFKGKAAAYKSFKHADFHTFSKNYDKNILAVHFFIFLFFRYKSKLYAAALYKR